MAEPLGAEDYAQLYQMSTSSDDSARAQAAVLSKKLTPPEQQAFFDYQKAQHPQGEHGRVDNQVLGMPPEMVAAMAGPVAKAATQAGLTVGQRLGASFKSALGQAHPLVKYEITRSALEHLGVPSPLAMGVAIAVSGYKTGAPAAAESAAPASADAAATAAPAADSASAVGTTSPVPVAPTAAATATVKPAEAMAAVKDVFKTLKIDPGPADLTNAASMMKFGKTAEQAVARVLQLRLGASGDVAAKLAETLGTPSDATVGARVAARNATGRWQP